MKIEKENTGTFAINTYPETAYCIDNYPTVDAVDEKIEKEIKKTNDACRKRNNRTIKTIQDKIDYIEGKCDSNSQANQFAIQDIRRELEEYKQFQEDVNVLSTFGKDFLKCDYEQLFNCDKFMSFAKRFYEYSVDEIIKGYKQRIKELKKEKMYKKMYGLGNGVHTIYDIIEQRINEIRGFDRTISLKNVLTRFKRAEKYKCKNLKVGE